MSAATRVLVVGAGPAGSAAALAARRAGAQVLLIDKAEFPRDKVCGDGVAPQALDVLSVLGVDVDALTGGSAPVRTLRLTAPGGAVARRATGRPGWVVPRAVLDARLRDAAIAAGAQPVHHRAREVTVTADGVDVDGLVGDVLVAADGAESVVRRAVAPPPRPGTVALAIRGYAPSGPWPDGEQLLSLTAQHWPAYAWAFPIGDGRANVGYGEVLTGTPPTREHLLTRLHELLPDAEPTQLRAHRLPLSTGRVRTPDGRVLLVGDAAGLINPVTGEGIFYAVLSGALAGAAAAGGVDPGRSYRRALRRALGVHLRHTDALARLSRWPWVVDAGITAARGSQRVFDDVVELGLGDGRLGVRTGLSVARAGLRG
ncbi:geranylgeranyl reductase family protein [Rhodococcus antarcticus]|uniref:Geranylgeranyl reductase family protein n=1 Tax=Rhodococcus antarcticus TaxID=2987751 RepID=A0ABY6NZ03_9NOCA|nr:geranylgeranyl reductase family protein [Rhodococcus antarcticus]UZJ24173.1 geranylgeranyl reductase family protein [Rhodococcus antarcticus]